jgi:hypothetical protein
MLGLDWDQYPHNQTGYLNHQQNQEASQSSFLHGDHHLNGVEHLEH